MAEKVYLKKRYGKRIWLILSLLLLLTATVGCGRRAGQPGDKAEQRLRIVCTIFPEYDWVKQILGEQAKETELVLLMKNGADMHSYQPTVWDMKAISEADLFLYVGGESDGWVEDALANVKNSACHTLNLMEVLEDVTREEEHVEGMQSVRGHEHESQGTEEETEYDEHIWLSLRNTQTVCDAITETLCELDGSHRDIYGRNNREYQKKLHELDVKYTEAAEQARMPVLLFGDRFPFLYLMEDYNIAYYAAFAGCSAETEASFETIAFLAEKAGDLGLPAIMKIDGSDGKIARTIAENTGTKDQKVLLLDSMQSVSAQDIEEGETYLAVMERNLETLKEALLGADSPGSDSGQQ